MILNFFLTEILKAEFGTVAKVWYFCFCFFIWSHDHTYHKGRRGRNRMIVGFTTT